MRDGFVKVGCATPKLRVADVGFNAAEVLRLMVEAEKQGVKILVFPELCLTGYTAGDLFYHGALLQAAERALGGILQATERVEMLAFIGLPFSYGGKTYNVAAAIFCGKLLALIPKTALPNYNEFYEKRQFTPAKEGVREAEYCGQKTLFGREILLSVPSVPGLKIACEICEDLWIAASPSGNHARAGATVIVNLSASNELVGKSEYRRKLVSMQSAKLVCAYLYADAGVGESTTDMVFAGHDVIAENGRILKESRLFSEGLIVTETDVSYLVSERTKLFPYESQIEGYTEIPVALEPEETALTRTYPRYPFLPSDNERDERYELILSLQANALARRLAHVRASCTVVGISGGLDSALALLVAVRAKHLLPDEQKEKFTVYGITMPCFGTTDRTLKNARRLTNALGAKCVKISIRTAVNRHLSDIKQPKGVFDVTYENAQARERTQVLMDYANRENGLVVGTGDLSEAALGWATYNGDHMSMYGVNTSVPKTLVKHLVRFEGERLGGAVKATLEDILDTPISPELLPSDGKKIVQITEDKVGPYELHDFFLYYFVRYSFSPDKIFRLAKRTFDGVYDEATVEKWLRVFVKRFFAQQFKRSCVPDGVKIGSVSLSPRADWRMPSDAVCSVWLDTLEKKK